jgi:hypothetical protein
MAGPVGVVSAAMMLLGAAEVMASSSRAEESASGSW